MRCGITSSKHNDLNVLTADDDISNEALVDLAYSLVVEPHRLRALTCILHDRLQSIHDHAGQEDYAPANVEDLNDVTRHFDRAGDLLDRQGRRFHYATGSKQFIDMDTRPSALLRADGSIYYTNQTARDTLHFANDVQIKKAQFNTSDYERLMADLAAIKSYEINKLIAVYDLQLLNGKQMKMALAKTIDYDGNPVGRLYTFHIKWLVEAGRQFQDGFDLTPVDIAITEAVVTGSGLRRLAETRGRSLGTIRNQSKALLAKLGLHSQTELICLYSGFTNLGLKDPTQINTPRTSVERWRKTAFLELPDKRKMQYELVGPEDGRPVLYFHALIGGHVLTKVMRAELLARKIRLIMVWRPHFAGTSANGGWRTAPARFAADIEHLLDHLEIKHCQILGHITGSIYAFACTQRLPNRILGIVNCGGCIPIETRAQYKLMTSAFRVSVYMARYTPKLIPMFVKGALAKIDAGYDEEVVYDQFEHSPPDLAVLQEPEFKSASRKAYHTYTSSGHKMFSHDLPLVASKWGYLLDKVLCPVTLVHGKHDPAFAYSTIETFVQNKPNFTVQSYEDAGQLVMYQYPEAAFSALDAQYVGINSEKLSA